MMRVLVGVSAAQQYFQPAVPAFSQTGLRGGLAPVETPVVQVLRVPVTPAPSAPASVSALAVIAGMVSGAAAYAITSGSASRARRVTMVGDPYEVDALNKTGDLTDPRLGNPFEPDGPRVAVEAYQPRGISDATVPKKQYIETDDEPWHSTCVETVAIGAEEMSKALSASIPYIAAEEALILAVSKAEKKDAVKSAMAEATAAGARKGSKALMAAEKVLKAFDEKTEEEAMKARPKAPKDVAMSNGWDGMKKALGGVHSTAGFL